MTDFKAMLDPGASSGDPHGSKASDAKDTRSRLLDAAIEEFCRYGRTAANTARIVASAKCNIRMLYHYFGNKDGLYKAALLQVYTDLRQAEARETFWTMEPQVGIARFAEFTFDYMCANPRFPKMILAENLDGGTTVATLNEPFEGSRDLIANLDTLIARGQDTGTFSRRPQAFDLYLTILGLSFIHISSRHTLSRTFNVDLEAKNFLAARRIQVVDTAMSYLGLTH